MEHRHRRASVGEVILTESEILAQLNRMDGDVISDAEMKLEMGRLRELHQVLVYRIEILRRINNGEM